MFLLKTPFNYHHCLCSTLRAPHRGTSLCSCVCVASTRSLCTSTANRPHFYLDAKETTKTQKLKTSHVTSHHHICVTATQRHVRNRRRKSNETTLIPRKVSRCSLLDLSLHNTGSRINFFFIYQIKVGNSNLW
jgi:hypothetical protein